MSPPCKSGSRHGPYHTVPAHHPSTNNTDKAPKIQRSSCTPRWYCERWFWILCSIHWTRFISITNDSIKSHGYHIQTARVRRTTSGCSIFWTQVKLEDAPQVLKIPKSECPDIWVRLPRHKWPKSWSTMEDPVVPIQRNQKSHLLAGLLLERQFGKILLQHVWDKVSNWECSFVHRDKRLLLSVYVHDIKLAGKNPNIDPMWKILNKEVDLGVYLGCTQRPCEISKDIAYNYRTMLESRISAGAAEKLPCSEKTSNFFVVLWYGMSCQEMCGTMLWVGK